MQNNLALTLQTRCFDWRLAHFGKELFKYVMNSTLSNSELEAPGLTLITYVNPFIPFLYDVT